MIKVNGGLEQEILDAINVDPAKGLEDIASAGSTNGEVEVPPPVDMGYDFKVAKNQLTAGNQYHFYQTFKAGDLTIYVNIEVKVSDSTLTTIVWQQDAAKKRYNGKVMEDAEVLAIYGYPVKKEIQIKDSDGNEKSIEVVQYFKRLHNSMEEFLEWITSMVNLNGKVTRSKLWVAREDEYGNPVLNDAGKPVMVQVWSKPLGKKDKPKVDKPKVTIPHKTEDKPSGVAQPTGKRLRHRGSRITKKVTYITVQAGGVVNINL